MARRKTPQIPHLPYHLYNRVLDRAFFPGALSEIWNSSLELLSRCRQVYPVSLHGFVLMGNHYHLLASCAEGRVDRIAQYFQSRLSTRVGTLHGTQRYRFQSRYGRTLLPTAPSYLVAMRYVAQNPVRAALVPSYEDYPYSSWSKNFREPFLDDLFAKHAFQSEWTHQQLQRWMSEPLRKPTLEGLRSGFRKKTLETLFSRTLRKPVPFDPNLRGF